MSTFRIGYKSFYRETSDHHSDYVDAENERAALNAFASKHRIKRTDRKRSANWKWWDKEYLYELRAIEQVEMAPCPHCNGSGEINVTKPASPT